MFCFSGHTKHNNHEIIHEIPEEVKEIWNEEKSRLTEQSYEKYTMFCFTFKDLKPLGAPKIKNFLARQFLKAGIYTKHLVTCRASNKAASKISIAALYNLFKKEYAGFADNIVRIEGGEFSQDFWSVVEDWGEVIFSHGEISEKTTLNINAAAEFCVRNNIFDAASLFCVYRKIKDKEIPSPDKRMPEITEQEVISQRENATAVFENASMTLKYCENITKAAQWITRNGILKKHRAHFLYKAILKHAKCCVRDFCFLNEGGNCGLDVWLAENNICVRHFAGACLGMFLGIEKSPRNILLFSDHQSIGKTTLAHALADFVYPRQALGTLCLNDAGIGKYLLGLCKDRSLIITDDLAAGDYGNLEKNQDCLDGIFPSPMNEKCGTYGHQICSPHLFTSNKLPKHTSTLRARLEIFSFSKPKKLKDYLSKEDLPHAICLILLNYMSFAECLKIPLDTTDAAEKDAIPSFEFPSCKPREFFDRFQENVPVSLTFKKAPHFNDDFIILKFLGEEYTIRRFET